MGRGRAERGIETRPGALTSGGPASGDWEREDETRGVGAWRWDWGRGRAKRRRRGGEEEATGFLHFYHHIARHSYKYHFYNNIYKFTIFISRFLYFYHIYLHNTSRGVTR